ncbi:MULTISPECIES: glutamyl-tRNA reductase [unclassified Streptomyces]|uniref:glutamyl-tRNA reductase n=1 Tax=unclassified Streptomyces TaxID=2593676 RepID=UPI00203035E0|nr:MULTISPECIES: glutamyl-tRNA reductase [unclassified Streptomyces]MCM1967494.1 glutamyl-tRNA reductase [Streptomyces sp. G1]MCX5123363.1 glutamyl-tRNA reductase [Streptomyces sp. NBC_00347]MCX5296710.1 glutamyl-tRNA reductase [Streptomyces sp. NBC_00193]
MSLLVVGLSHRSAPVSVLERASLAADAKVKLLHDTLAAEPAAEAAVLATCNRIELYADVDKFHAGVAELSTLLAQHSGVALEELTPYLYVHYEDRAVHHLFSVACGLDSMVVGEGQILGQIKDALALGQELHTAGRLINDLFQQALRVGKRAHSETGIDRAGQSLVTFGLEQLAVHVPVEEWAAGKRALVIGAGSMSSLAAATLARVGVAEVVVANRTADRAERLAEILVASGTGVAASAIAMSGVADELARVDVVVSCTGATGLVLTGDDVAAAVEAGPAGAVPYPPFHRSPELRPGPDAGAAPLPGAGPRTPAPQTPAGLDMDAELVARLAVLAAGGRRIADAGAVRSKVVVEERDGCPVGLDALASDPGRTADGRAALAGVDAGSLELHGTWADQGEAAAQRQQPRKGVRNQVDAQPVRLALLDLAMPRDIDAAVHRIPGVRLVDIESLAEASADAPMAADVDAVRAIVAAEVAAFGAAQRAAHITPTVVALRAMAAEVVAMEVARLDGRVPDLDERQRAEVTQTVRRVVDKLLHAPTVRVKQLASEPGGAGYAEALRELFDLDPQTVASVSRADEADKNHDSGRAS